MDTMRNLLFHIGVVKALKADPSMHFHSIMLAEKHRDEYAQQVRTRVFKLAFRDLKLWRTK